MLEFQSQQSFTRKRLGAFTLVLILSLTLLSGCAWFSKSDDGSAFEDPTISAAQLYEEANQAMQRGNYEDAIKKYETLEGRYPFGAYTEQAQLEVAYAYYRYEEPDSAIAAADRYIQLHPRGKNVDYALYLKGLANMSRGDSIINRIANPRLARRDQRILKEAFETFTLLVERYPDSRYVDDASQRLITLRNTMAEHELYVARYYMRRNAWLAAANRAQTALEKYDGSTSTIPALELLIEAYGKLGLESQQDEARQVLEATLQANPTPQET